jgi:hypothetical protein
MDENLDDAPSRTLLPRFSIRTLLWLVTGCALVFVVVGMAGRGETWAWGVSLGVASLLLTAMIHAAWFYVVWLFGRMTEARPKDVG